MFEKKFMKKNHSFIAGVDEVGRGTLAGPVVGCCCLIKGDLSQLIHLINLFKSKEITDSKKNNSAKRERLLIDLGINILKNRYWKIKLENFEIQLKITVMNSCKIDKINILEASLLSMKNSFESIAQKNEKGSLLIDGNQSFKTNTKYDVFTVVKGDVQSSIIGLASIVAKVYRDNLMKKYARKYSNYGFERNFGYGTLQHRMAIKAHGVTTIHRKTFSGVKEFV